MLNLTLAVSCPRLFRPCSFFILVLNLNPWQVASNASVLRPYLAGSRSCPDLWSSCISVVHSAWQQFVNQVYSFISWILLRFLTGQYTRWIKCKIETFNLGHPRLPALAITSFSTWRSPSSEHWLFLVDQQWLTAPFLLCSLYMPWKFLWVDLFDSPCHLRLGRPTSAIHVPPLFFSFSLYCI
jgi:hypothetical protein